MKPPVHCKSLGSFKNESGAPIHLAIGMFDGVHLGHRLVVDSAIEAARTSGGIAGVLTFWPHPSHLFTPDSPVHMILNSRMKFAELDKLDIDFVIEEPFTDDFAGIESTEFVEMLRAKLPGLASLHTGSNWRFGNGRRGDVLLLRKLAREAGIESHSLECLYLEGDRVSSTRIRQALVDGRIQAANRMLGYNYESFGTVEKGEEMGRTIGVPTLNIPFDGELFPRFGVYFARVSSEDGNESLPAVANFGVRPTVNALERPILEAHILQSCPFGYGDRLRVEWERFSRPERKFGSVDALKRRILEDIDQAKAFFEDGAPNA